MGKKILRKKNKIQFMHIEPGLYPNIVVIVVATNDEVHKCKVAQIYEYNRIHVSVDKVTPKIAIQLPGDQSVFIIQKLSSVSLLVVT